MNTMRCLGTLGRLFPLTLRSPLGEGITFTAALVMSPPSIDYHPVEVRLGNFGDDVCRAFLGGSGVGVGEFEIDIHFDKRAGAVGVSAVAGIRDTALDGEVPEQLRARHARLDSLVVRQYVSDLPGQTCIRPIFRAGRCSVRPGLR